MSKNRKMLIIDDIKMNTELFEAEFEDEFEISVAGNGTEGLTAASAVRPDVILLDINMPDMSGIEVMRNLQARPETCAIPVVVVTASEYNAATEQKLRPYANFKGFLSKMDSSEIIKKAVYKALK
ncbi:MAG: response regulator [Elusimicrobiales bacterium]|jgi:CheY-like chemotaxis protein